MAVDIHDLLDLIHILQRRRSQLFDHLPAVCREENEVYRILYTLTAMVASVSPVMGENISMLERIRCPTGDMQPALRHHAV